MADTVIIRDGTTPAQTYYSQINLYQLLSDAYFGEGGFLTGTYLTKHGRELDGNYSIRKDIAYYLNYVAPTVNSHVDPVFKKEAQREYNGNAYFKAYMENCDAVGADFPAFMKQAATLSKLFGCVFIVTDNVSEKADNVEDAIKGRKFPYSYVVEPKNVVDYTLSTQGRLTKIAFKEYGTDGETIYVREWTETEWILYDENKTKIINREPHGLGRVPVTVFKSRPVLPKVLMPTSEFAQIARANRNLYNKCSWLDEILKNQAFSILLFPSKNVSDIVVGTNNALGFDGIQSKFAPSFIAPPADPAAMLKQDRDDLIKEIYRMAAMSHVTGVQQAESGVAKKWDFENTNMALSSFTLNCENAEKDVVAVFELWTSQPVNYTVTYPRDFGIVDLGESLDNAQKALDLNFGIKFKIEVLKRLMPEYFPNADQKIIDDIIAEIEQIGIDAAYAERQMAANNKPPGDATNIDDEMMNDDEGNTE